MKSEQKRRAIQMINAIKTRGSTVSLDAVAALLQELIDAEDRWKSKVKEAIGHAEPNERSVMVDGLAVFFSRADDSITDTHTPEPWIFEAPDADHEGIIIGRRGGAVVDGDFTEANARRIVAAVNACESIPTEDLESIAGRIALKSVMQMHANYVSNKAKVAAMEQQRDKLLAALTEIAELDILKYHHAYAIAKGAIEEIEALKCSNS